MALLIEPGAAFCRCVILSHLLLPASVEIGRKLRLVGWEVVAEPRDQKWDIHWEWTDCLLGSLKIFRTAKPQRKAWMEVALFPIMSDNKTVIGVFVFFRWQNSRLNSLIFLGFFKRQFTIKFFASVQLNLSLEHMSIFLLPSKKWQTFLKNTHRSCSKIWMDA